MAVSPCLSDEAAALLLLGGPDVPLDPHDAEELLNNDEDDVAEDVNEDEGEDEVEEAAIELHVATQETVDDVSSSVASSSCIRGGNLTPQPPRSPLPTLKPPTPIQVDLRQSVAETERSERRQPEPSAGRLTPAQSLAQKVRASRQRRRPLMAPVPTDMPGPVFDAVVEHQPHRVEQQLQQPVFTRPPPPIFPQEVRIKSLQHYKQRQQEQLQRAHLQHQQQQNIQVESNTKVHSFPPVMLDVDPQHFVEDEKPVAVNADAGDDEDIEVLDEIIPHPGGLKLEDIAGERERRRQLQQRMTTRACPIMAVADKLSRQFASQWPMSPGPTSPASTAIDAGDEDMKMFNIKEESVVPAPLQDQSSNLVASAEDNDIIVLDDDDFDTVYSRDSSRGPTLETIKEEEDRKPEKFDEDEDVVIEIDEEEDDDVIAQLNAGILSKEKVTVDHTDLSLSERYIKQSVSRRRQSRDLQHSADLGRRRSARAAGEAVRPRHRPHDHRRLQRRSR